MTVIDQIRSHTGDLRELADSIMRENEQHAARILQEQAGKLSGAEQAIEVIMAQQEGIAYG